MAKQPRLTDNRVSLIGTTVPGLFTMDPGLATLRLIGDEEAVIDGVWGADNDVVLMQCILATRGDGRRSVRMTGTYVGTDSTYLDQTYVSVAVGDARMLIGNWARIAAGCGCGAARWFAAETLLAGPV